MPRIDIDVIEKPPEAKVISTLDGEMKKGSGIAPLSAFLAFPANVSFSGEQSDEQVILLMRAHVITTVPWIITSLIIFMAPSFIFPLLFKYNIIPSLTGSQAFCAGVFWYLGGFTYAFLNFLYWFFNVYIVTNEQVVDVDWYSVIYRKISSAQISKIQDVTSKQGGVLAGVFDFGDVIIQTASELPNFDFSKVPHPQLVVRKLKELMQKEELQWERK